MDGFKYAENLFSSIAEALMHTEAENPMFWSDGEKILCEDRDKVLSIAWLLDDIAGRGVSVTGYYDPEEDRRTGCVDEYTGYHYVKISD